MGWLASLLNSVGSLEVALLGLAVAVALAASICMRAYWILGFALCFVAATLFTPPDPMSTLLVAVPLCGIFGLACRRRGKGGVYD